jgi:hypothetical protein
MPEHDLITSELSGVTGGSSDSAQQVPNVDPLHAHRMGPRLADRSHVLV